MISFQQVLRRYTLGNEEWTLGPLSFEIPDGQTVGILGTSGSGKSTLLHLLGALDTPTEGEIFVNGFALSHFSEPEKDQYRASTVGFVFQDFHLFPEFRVRENIAFPLILQGVSPEEQKTRIDEMLKNVGLEGFGNHFPKELSGGQRQRVAVARALIHRPQILLADEPTGNLDEKTGEQMMDLLQSLVETHHMTVVLVTHNKKFAHQCDRVLTIENGKIASSLGGNG
ncbi:MAG: ABC transporter ATP-binding protein [Candidatus Peregrinibacteria bacterium]